MVMEVSAVAPLNAEIPIEVRVLVPSNVMEVSEVASKNAEVPIDVTLAGIVMEVSEVALLNAEVPIDVTPAGITAAPVHEASSDTTPESIVKVPPPSQATGVPCAGVEIKASSSAEMVAARTEYLRI